MYIYIYIYTYNFQSITQEINGQDDNECFKYNEYTAHSNNEPKYTISQVYRFYLLYLLYYMLYLSYYM